MKQRQVTLLIAATGVSLLAEAQTMTDLGILPGDSNSISNGASRNGSVVVGYSDGPAGWLAFQWTGGAMTSLGSLTAGGSSMANSVSADGSVIVGYSTSPAGIRALRWTDGVMTNLGTLPGGTLSIAHGVSADGSVIVGRSGSAAGNRAFRWAGGVMSDLGTLAGGNSSRAYGVSANGLVVVGESTSITGDRAFRWTDGGMSDLGTLAGGSYSRAYGVSANGSFVVGDSDSTTGVRAFRWTDGVMSDLGTLAGGNFSRARGISADGSVIVGQSGSAAGNRAFRWAGGVMSDLGTLAGGYSSFANGVSADGNIVVGYSEGPGGLRAFLYTHRVMLDVQDWLGSVGGVNSLLSSSLELSRTFMEGAHHRPLAELGRGRSYWVTGDLASSSRSRDLRTRSGEAGVTFEAAPNVLIGVGGGYGRQERNLANGGAGATDGQYLIGEADFIQPDGGIFSVLASAGDWRATTDRAYATGAGIDTSHGETDLQSTSLRLRYDTTVLTKAFGAEIKAYVSGSWSKAQSDAYSEAGGSYAGSFGELEQTAKEGRLGVVAMRAFGEKFRGRLSAEWIRRFDRDQTMLTATDITSTLDLSLPGAPVVRNQARFGFDLDYLMDAKTTLSFTVHAASRGESPDVSGAISLRRGF
jgi:probable HAF family extracellular repeat protein